MTTSTNITRLTSKEACTLAHKIRRETGCSLTEAFKQAYSSNKPAPIKTSWTKAELNKVFSDKVAELLRKSYIIDTDHMSGSQGEIAKVLFIKDNAHYQLIMESKNEYTIYYGESVVIRFGKYNEDESTVYPHSTLWISRFDTTWSMTVIKITENYYVTEELAQTFRTKKESRMGAQYSTKSNAVDLNRYGKVLLACVRKQKGFKSLKLTDILSASYCTERDWRTDAIIGHSYNVKINKLNKYGKNINLNIKLINKAN